MSDEVKVSKPQQSFNLSNDWLNSLKKVEKSIKSKPISKPVLDQNKSKN